MDVTFTLLNSVYGYDIYSIMFMDITFDKCVQLLYQLSGTGAIISILPLWAVYLLRTKCSDQS